MPFVELPADLATWLNTVPLEKRTALLAAHGFQFPLQQKKVEPILSSSSEKATLHTDGASRGNPGNAGIGFLLADQQGKILFAGKKYIGITTNNVAEWTALVTGLEKALELGIEKLGCFLDSELVVKQLNGAYRVKNADLLRFFQKAQELKKQFTGLTFTHVPREQNARADLLSNQAIDERA